MRAETSLASRAAGGRFAGAGAGAGAVEGEGEGAASGVPEGADISTMLLTCVSNYLYMQRGGDCRGEETPAVPGGGELAAVASASYLQGGGWVGRYLGR